MQTEAPEGIDTRRLRELAARLVMSGPKACGVSASECHEISKGLNALIDEVERLRREREDFGKAHTW
jgi:hypothetical protein